MEIAEQRFRRAALLTTGGVCAVAIFFMPGIDGGYRLSRFGLTGLVISCLAIYAFRLAPYFRQALPPQIKLMSWAGAYALTAIILPLSTPYPLLHASGVAQLALGLGLCYLVAMIFQQTTLAHRQHCLHLLTWTGGVIATVIILQQIGFPLLIQNLGGPEFQGQATFGNPNWAAAFLLPLVPVTLGLRQECSQTKTRWADTFLTILLIAGILATLSKGGIIAMIAGIVLYLMLGSTLQKKTKILLLIILSFFCVTIIFYGTMQGWHQSLPWVRGRLFLWQTALHLITAHPFTGIGLGGFLPAYPQAAATLINGDATAFMPLGTIRFLHNDFLQTIVEGGIPSALFFVIFILSAIQLGHRHGNEISRGVAAGLGALALYGMIDSPLHVPSSWILFWFLTGILLALPVTGQPKSADILSPRKRQVLMIALLTAALFSLVQGFRHLAGIIIWDKGKDTLKIRTIARSLANLSIASMLLPEIAGVRLDHARALAMKEQYSEALKESEVAMSLSADFNTLFFHAELTEYSVDQQTAKNEWEALRSSFPMLIRPYYELGRLAILIDDFSEARRQLTQAQEIRQDSSGAREYRQQATALLQAIETQTRK
ncbi:MAG: O-antigen ligase family protein [Proteobacteria bacterium]|nr:O-antigen ligase family protein [Pseudomonadota bacterium]MBU1714322.1 O-antigen ligase family protein [Pseudomonadota bacterium]